MSDKLAPQATAEPLLITVHDVATILGISVRSVWRLRDSGQIISSVRVGGAVRWRRDEILQWIKDGCPRPPRKPR